MLMDLIGPKNVFTLSREIFEHSYVGAGNGGRDPWTRLEAWAWLIARANFRPSEIDVRGEIVTLRRGQLIITLQALAERWRWSIKQVRTFLDRIQQLDMIGRETGTPKGSHQTLITIRNYDIYQFLEDYLGHPKRQPKGNPRAAQGQQSNKKNKENTTSHGSGACAQPEVQEAFDAYNAAAERKGLTRALKLTPGRQKEIRNRLGEVGGIEGWRRMLDNVEASPFLCGAGEKGFKADLDWLLKSEKFVKVCEGGYGPTKNANGSAISIEAEINRLAGSELGRRLISEKGHEAALAYLRDLVQSQAEAAYAQ
jgi:hypothetical protein